MNKKMTQLLKRAEFSREEILCIARCKRTPIEDMHSLFRNSNNLMAVIYTLISDASEGTRDVQQSERDLEKGG